MSKRIKKKNYKIYEKIEIMAHIIWLLVAIIDFLLLVSGIILAILFENWLIVLYSIISVGVLTFIGYLFHIILLGYSELIKNSTIIANNQYKQKDMSVDANNIDSQTPIMTKVSEDN